MKFTLYEVSTGRVVMTGEGFTPTPKPGEALLLGVRAGLDDLVIDGHVEHVPPRPSPHHVYNRDSGAWELPPDRAAFLVRCQRDRLLKDSDWTQLADIPEATRARWTAYRQALRDITKQAGFPLHVQFPPPPEG